MQHLEIIEKLIDAGLTFSEPAETVYKITAPSCAKVEYFSRTGTMKIGDKVQRATLDEVIEYLVGLTC